MTNKKTKMMSEAPSKIGCYFRFDADGKLFLFNPFCGGMPADLFFLVMKKISEAEKEYNESIKNRKSC